MVKYQRVSKALFVGCIGIFALLVTMNNFMDYGANFQFVQHVLMMDSVFPDNPLSWRAIDSPIIHHLCYWLIIATETAIAALCLAGAVLMWRNRFDQRLFQHAKWCALMGLSLAVLLWFLGFMIIGGEWFLMWQSEKWNGQQSAFRFTVVIFLCLMYLVVPEYEPQQGN